MEQAETTGTVTSTYAEIAKVFRHAMVYGIASVTSGVIGFIMIPVYTRCLSPADYGIVELLQLTSNVLGIVLGMGFSTAVLRFYFQYDSERDRHEVISTALAVLVAVGTGVTILLLFGSEWLGRLVLGESGYGLFAALMLLTSLFGLVLIVPLAYVRALERSALYGGIAIGRLLLGLTLNIVFVVVLRMGVLGVLLSALVVALVSAIGLLGGTLRKVRLAVSRVKLRQMATYGGPLVPASLSMFVLHFADRFFLERAASLEQVGLYALGYKFAMMLPMLVMEPFGLVWGAAMFAVAKRDDARDIYGKVCTYFFCVATFFALGVSVLIKDALKIIATPQFLAAHRVVPIVMVGLLFLAAANFFETGIHLARRTVFRALAVGSAAGLTLLLNWLLVPRFGMMGAAWATLLSFAALAAVSYILGQRLYRITYEFSRLAKLTGAAAFLYWASTWVHVASTAGSIGVRCALVLLYPALLYVLGFYRHEELAKVARLGHVVATSAYGWLRYAPMRSSE